MSDPYLYYNSIKDTPVCGHLDFNCLKLKYEVYHDILLFILAPGYTVSTWRCVVLTVYHRYRCQTIARYTGKFSPHLKVKLKFTLVLLNSFFKNTRSKSAGFFQRPSYQDLNCFPHMKNLREVLLCCT